MAPVQGVKAQSGCTAEVYGKGGADGRGPGIVTPVVLDVVTDENPQTTDNYGHTFPWKSSWSPTRRASAKSFPPLSAQTLGNPVDNYLAK
jgi:hypothetical protein